MWANILRSLFFFLYNPGNEGYCKMTKNRLKLNIGLDFVLAKRDKK